MYTINKCNISTGDGRNDSPGHSAQYCTYTIMDEQTSTILDMQVVDKREVDYKSTNMEKEALKRGLQSLKREKLNLKELVTDAHVQIKSFMGW